MSLDDAFIIVNIIAQSFVNMLGIVGAMVFFGYQFWIKKEAIIGGGKLRRGLLVCFVLNAILVVHALLLLPMLRVMSEHGRKLHIWADIVLSIVVVVLLGFCTVGILIRVLRREYINERPLHPAAGGGGAGTDAATRETDAEEKVV